MSEYILTSTFVLSTSAWVLYKWSEKCRRRSDMILRKTADLPARRVSAPDQREISSESAPSVSPPLNLQSPSNCRSDKCSLESKSSRHRSPVLQEVADATTAASPSCVVTEFLVDPPDPPVLRGEVNATLPGQRKISPRRLTPLKSPRSHKTADIKRDRSPASPSFPLSPSMVVQLPIPLMGQPDYTFEMKSMIQEWGFMASIRKKKLPLNKYGLPDISADVLEEEMPRKKLRDEMRKRFRDMTEERLISGWHDGSGFTYVIDLFSELLDLICSFVGRRQGEKFRKTLDIDVLRQMVKAHVYTPEEFQNTLKLCIGLLYELESPYQHTLTQQWWQEFDHDYASHEEYAVAICDSIMYLFRKCDFCKIEVENFYISRISITDRRLREKVAFEKIPLKFRTPWDCSTKASFFKGLIVAMSNQSLKLKENEVTSCLACDLPTLHVFQNSIQEATVLSVMSVVLNKILITLEADNLEKFFITVLEAYYHRSGPSIIFETLKTHIPESEHQVASEACDQIVKCADTSDPLYKVLLDRAIKYLVPSEPGQMSDPNRCDQAFGLKPDHLCHANQRIQRLKELLVPFVDEHWEVYASCYAKSPE